MVSKEASWKAFGARGCLTGWQCQTSNLAHNHVISSLMQPPWSTAPCSLFATFRGMSLLLAPPGCLSSTAPMVPSFPL